MDDGYDPDHYETKKNRDHIQMVSLMAEFAVGLTPTCPCGDALKEKFYEGEKYWMCKKYKFDSFLHYRKRWDTAVTEEIERMKEKNEDLDKQMRELRFELDRSERKMQVEIEAKSKEVGQVYDLLRQMACGCKWCKHTVDTTLLMKL